MKTMLTQPQRWETFLLFQDRFYPQKSPCEQDGHLWFVLNGARVHLAELCCRARLWQRCPCARQQHSAGSGHSSSPPRSLGQQGTCTHAPAVTQCPQDQMPPWAMLWLIPVACPAPALQDNKLFPTPMFSCLSPKARQP